MRSVSMRSASARAVDSIGRSTDAGSRRIDALQRVVRQREVLHGARERAEVVEAGDERIAAGARQPAVGRLQPERAAQRSRHADRAVGVGAERQRHLAGCDRRGRAARRAARHAGRVVRVAGRSVVRVLGREAVGVLVHVERADQHRTGAFEARDQRAVVRGRRTLALDLRAGAGRQAGHVEQVLDRERHAEQRCRAADGLVAGSELGIDLGGAPACPLAVMSVNALTTPSVASMRARLASTMSAALTARVRTACAIAAALLPRQSFAFIARASCCRRRRDRPARSARIPARRRPRRAGLAR